MVDFFGPLPEDDSNFDQLLIWLGQQTISFQKIITGALQVGQDISSPDFIAGTSGWIIRGDGTAEFNGVVIRGTLDADDITAGTLTADRLILGSSDNLVQNPGIETGLLAPHAAVAGGGSWAAHSTTVRSGGKSALFNPSGQTTAGELQLNGARASTGSLEKHVACGEGETFYFSCYVRPSGTGPWNDVQIRLGWHDETESSISNTSVTFNDAALTDFAWNLIEVSGSAPAGTAYVVPWIVVIDNDKNGTFLFDDFYCRRKIGTLIIEGQAVDIERLLEPIYTEVQNDSDTNKSLTTVYQITASATLTVPSFVGVVDVQTICHSQITASATQQSLIINRIAGVDRNSREATMVSGDILDQATAAAVSISSPGSTILVEMRWRLNTGVNSSNASTVIGQAIGLR